jgi:hypothetical protein
MTKALCITYHLLLKSLPKDALSQTLGRQLLEAELGEPIIGEAAGRVQ